MAGIEPRDAQPTKGLPAIICQNRSSTDICKPHAQNLTRPGSISDAARRAFGHMLAVMSNQELWLCLQHLANMYASPTRMVNNAYMDVLFPSHQHGVFYEKVWACGRSGFTSKSDAEKQILDCSSSIFHIEIQGHVACRARGWLHCGEELEQRI